MKQLARRLGRLLARHHGNPVARGIARLCHRIYKHAQNVDVDIRTDGEAEILRRLSPMAFGTILDVGANVGDWARVALEHFPGAVIHCFEPIPDTAEILAERLGWHANVVVNVLALADREGELELNHFPHVNALSTIHPYPHRAGGSRRVLCKVVRGDEYLRLHAIPRVDMLKIDVEGAEDLVLRGFAESLQRGTIDVIQFEYSRINILSKFLLYDFYQLLGRHGFAIGKVFPDHVDFRDYSFGHENFIGYNHLAVRRSRDDLIALVGARSRRQR